MALAREMLLVHPVGDMDMDNWHDVYTLHRFLHGLLFSACADDKKDQSKKAQV